MGRLKPGGGARKRGDRELNICSVELDTKHIIDQCTKLTRERSRIQFESVHCSRSIFGLHLFPTQNRFLWTGGESLLKVLRHWNMGPYVPQYPIQIFHLPKLKLPKTKHIFRFCLYSASSIIRSSWAIFFPKY